MMSTLSSGATCSTTFKKILLRRSVAMLASAAVFGVTITAAAAQQFPTQDIRFVCGFPPGSGADVLVRYFSEKIRPLAGKTILVENKVGAAGHIAMEYVARSKPDGYTMLLSGASGVAGKHEPRQKATDRRGDANSDRRHDQPAAIYDRRPREQALQDARRPHCRDQGQRRKGDLRNVQSQFDDHGRGLQADDRRKGGAGELPDRSRHGERSRQRVARFCSAPIRSRL